MTGADYLMGRWQSLAVPLNGLQRGRTKRAMSCLDLVLGMFISVIFPNRQPTLVNRLLTVNRQEYLYQQFSETAFFEGEKSQVRAHF